MQVGRVQLEPCDGDGSDNVSHGGDDCDDFDVNRYPGNVEIADFEGHDEDCNPWTIASTAERPLWYNYYDGDDDRDGFINNLVYNEYGRGRRGDDCDDNDPAVNPHQVEVCNLKDDNCNGEVDEGVQMTAYRDDDGDLFGNPAIWDLMCPHQVSGGWVANNTDCDDTDPTANPINGKCSD